MDFCFSSFLVIIRLLRAFNIQISILRRGEGGQRVLKSSDHGNPFISSKFHFRPG